MAMVGNVENLSPRLFAHEVTQIDTTGRYSGGGVMEEIAIISMWRPWANWVGLGWKTIETRTHRRFKSLVGQRIGIHCAIKWDKTAIEQAGQWLTPTQRALTLGFLQVGGCVSWTAFVAEGRDLTAADSGAALIDCGNVQRYGLVLTDIQTIEMVPMRGHQGIWRARL